MYFPILSSFLVGQRPSFNPFTPPFSLWSCLHRYFNEKEGEIFLKAEMFQGKQQKTEPGTFPIILSDVKSLKPDRLREGVWMENESEQHGKIVCVPV